MTHSRRSILGLLAAAPLIPHLPNDGVALTSAAHPIGAPVSGDLCEATLEEMLGELRGWSWGAEPVLWTRIWYRGREIRWEAIAPEQILLTATKPLEAEHED